MNEEKKQEDGKEEDQPELQEPDAPTSGTRWRALLVALIIVSLSNLFLSCMLVFEIYDVDWFEEPPEPPEPKPTMTLFEDGPYMNGDYHIMVQSTEHIKPIAEYDVYVSVDYDWDLAWNLTDDFYEREDPPDTIDSGLFDRLVFYDVDEDEMISDGDYFLVKECLPDNKYSLYLSWNSEDHMLSGQFFAGWGYEIME